MNGRWLLPGMIDDQVHFREPGLAHKADIASESRACVAGGITSFMEMPNTNPPATDHAALEAKHARAEDVSRVNHAFHLGATNDNLEQICTLDPKAAPGIKAFMGASTGNMLVDDPDTLDAIVSDTPVPLITHREDTPMILVNEEAARMRWGEDIAPERHPLIRSREACMKSTLLAISAARRNGTRLHVLHISTAEKFALFEPAPVTAKRITAESCVHFLDFCDEDCARLGSLIKCNPAIKNASDRTAITQALAIGRVDVLTTDHAPHRVTEKSAKYPHSPSGFPLVQSALQCAMERVFDGVLELERVVVATTHAPATLFDVKERGFLRDGFHADLVLVDPKKRHNVTAAEVLSKCSWTPFEGTTFRSSIAATFVNGRLAWYEGKLAAAARGMRLEFAR